MKLKVFWVFGWSQYYPGGSIRNLRDTFYTFEEAETFRASIENENSCDGGTEIVDVSSRLGIKPCEYPEDDG